MEQLPLSEDQINASALMAFGAPSKEYPNSTLAGIGPVIAGQDDSGNAVYYVELLFDDGRVERRDWPKPAGKYDRAAKNAAYYARTTLANNHREVGVVLCHDTHSFRGLVAVLGRQRDRQDQGPAEGAAADEAGGTERP